MSFKIMNFFKILIKLNELDSEELFKIQDNNYLVKASKISRNNSFMSIFKGPVFNTSSLILDYYTNDKEFVFQNPKESSTYTKIPEEYFLDSNFDEMVIILLSKDKFTDLSIQKNMGIKIDVDVVSGLVNQLEGMIDDRT